MRSLARSSIVLLLTAWLASACMEHTVYHSYQSIPSRGWGKRDTLVFHVSVPDSMKRLKLFAEVRNNSRYIYRNLYVVVGNNLQDSTAFATDTLELTLADEEGKWTGTGWGNLFQSSICLGTGVALHPGNYTFKVSQGMKDEQLIGISDVGLKVMR